MKNFKKLFVAGGIVVAAMTACSMVDEYDQELVNEHERKLHEAEVAIQDSIQAVKDSIQSVKDSIAKVEQAKDDATCPETFTDNRDSTVYDIVRIYDATVDAKARCWFKQNLNYKVKNSFCLDDENSNCRSYGRLYLGDLLKNENLCPEGSRVSSYADWKHLFRVIDPDSTGKRTYVLKAEGEWSTSGDASKAVDSYKFSALPGGVYDDDSETYPEDSKNDGVWWVYAKDEGINYLTIYAKNDIYEVMPIEDFSYAAGFGFSVRCVLDSTAKSLLSSSSSVEGDSTSSSSSGENSGTESSSSNGDAVSSSSSVEDEDDIVVSFENVDINGASQKGPFVQGTTVSIFELENGHNLIEKGSTKTTEIKSDDGKFAMSGLKLKSQFVRLGANGYFRNEVTGAASTSQLELKAIADLTRSKTININLMTHLEYYRVKYLVTNEGFRVNKAKNKADKEIFSNFFIDSKDFETPDKMSVVGPTDGDAALLAVSALFLGGAYNAKGEFQEALLTELLAKFSDGVEKTGTWDNDSIKTVMADWAAQAEVDDKHFSSIRKNVLGWGLSDSIGNFEKFLTNYWTTVLGIGACSDENKGAVVAIDSAYSKFYSKNGKSEDATIRNNARTRFICKDNKWERATDMEKDLYKVPAGEDGDVKNGSVNYDSVYVYDGSAWRLGTAMDSTLEKGGCTVAKLGKIVKANGKYYKCDKAAEIPEWRLADTDEYNTYEAGKAWPAGEDGDVRSGVVDDDLVYVYDEHESKWRQGDANDMTLGFTGCTYNRHGEKHVYTKKTPNSYYVCDVETTRWVSLSDKEYTVYGEECKVDGDSLRYPDNKNFAICDTYKAKGWRDATDSEKEKNKVCSQTRANEKFSFTDKDNVQYVCGADNKWLEYTFYMKFTADDKVKFFSSTVAYEVDDLEDKRDNKTYRVVRIGSLLWMAENLNYYDESNANLVNQSWCYNDVAANCELGGRLYSWTAAHNVSKNYLNDKVVGDLETEGEPVQGICPEDWRLPTTTELNRIFEDNDDNEPAAALSAYENVWDSEVAAYDLDGFSGLPTGVKKVNGTTTEYAYAGYLISYWTAHEDPSDSELASSYYVYYPLGSSISLPLSMEEYGILNKKTTGHAVRCVKTAE